MLDPLPAPDGLPKEASVIFIGRPLPIAWSLCEAVGRTPTSKRDDATRWNAHFDVLEVVFPNPPGPLVIDNGRQGTVSFQQTIAFATNAKAFYPRDPATVACEHTDAVMAQPYVVIAAFPVHISSGGSRRQKSPWDLGSDGRMLNAGFATLGEAREWARRLSIVATVRQ